MVAWPAATAVTTPSQETVATDLSDDDQITSFLVALEGETVAVTVDSSSTSKAIDDLSRDMPVTDTSTSSSVTGRTGHPNIRYIGQ